MQMVVKETEEKESALRKAYDKVVASLQTTTNDESRDLDIEVKVLQQELTSVKKTADEQIAKLTKKLYKCKLELENKEKLWIDEKQSLT